MGLFNKKIKTEYNSEKRNKMINYTHLNTHYCKSEQTVLAGDSITELLNDNELFAEYTQKTGTIVYNRGISGDTSDRLLERFDSNVLNINPSNIVLLIGTNDFGYGLPMGETISNIDKILECIEQKCPKANVIVQAVYPVNTKMRKYDKQKNKKIVELNKDIKTVSKKHNVNFLDLTEVLADNDGDFKKEFTYDGLHPTVFGYEEAVKRIIPLLK
ncbi:MAG: GDSL-type esterase/lipase family protein [Clostridium sp.]|nr:GDSL-type esterase/lipase family protein [Clostridium sp.]